MLKLNAIELDTIKNQLDEYLVRLQNMQLIKGLPLIARELAENEHYLVRCIVDKVESEMQRLDEEEMGD